MYINPNFEYERTEIDELRIASDDAQKTRAAQYADANNYKLTEIDLRELCESEGNADKDQTMLRFEENKRYTTGNSSDMEITIVKRTPKCLLIGFPDGENKWKTTREGDTSEYVKFSNIVYEAANIVCDEPQAFSIKSGDYIDTPRFLKVKIQKVFQNENNARKQGYHETTHYKNDAYGIYGKHTGKDQMQFAAFRK